MKNHQYLLIAIAILLLALTGALVLKLRPSVLFQDNASAVNLSQNQTANTGASAVIKPPATTIVPAFSSEIINAAEQMLNTPLYKDTTPPTGLLVDSNGNLIPNKILKNMFDYFLLNDQTPAHNGARYLIQKTIKSQFKQLSTDKLTSLLLQVDTIFSNYLAMIDYLSKNPMTSNDKELTQAFLDKLHQTRIDFLGTTVAQAFYEDIESEDAKTLQQKQTNTRPIVKQDFEIEKEAFAAKRLSVDERYAQRLQKYGPEVAERWRTLELERHQQKLDMIAFQNAWIAAGKPVFNQSNGRAESLLYQLPEDKREYVKDLVIGGQLDQAIKSLP